MAPEPNLRPDRPLTVMTRNLYLGADVDRVMAALSGASRERPPTALTEVVGEFLSTDLPARLAALAAELATERPHVAGLQEVTTLSVRLPSEYRVPPIEADFLAMLTHSLAELGVAYQVVSHLNFTLTLLDGAVTLADRDVLLVDASLPITGQATGRFGPPRERVVPGVGTLVRGWVRAETRIAGRAVALVSTHPESGDGDDIGRLRAEQMAELLETLAGQTGPVILMGDLNDVPGSPMHRVLTGAGFVDLWAALRPGEPGATCCHATSLRSGGFTRRIDYLMVRGGWLDHDRRVVSGARIRVIGESAAEMIPGSSGPIWPSDHGGVVASLPWRW